MAPRTLGAWFDDEGDDAAETVVGQRDRADLAEAARASAEAEETAAAQAATLQRLVEVEEHIRSTGFYRAKARNIVKLANELVDEYDGEIFGLETSELEIEEDPADSESEAKPKDEDSSKA